ncbi:MAG: hypothetical protein LC104_17245 [Bacteroidales bacterium]|nr:hypothetical protein [Bacteroidales bacterium]
MLMKLLTGVLAAASVTLLGFYVASSPQPTPMATTALTVRSGEAGPSCCATVSRGCCLEIASCCGAEDSAANPTETVAACVGGVALASHSTTTATAAAN